MALVKSVAILKLHFLILLPETLGYHCAANRISTRLPDYHAFLYKTKLIYLLPDTSLSFELLSLSMLAGILDRTLKTGQMVGGIGDLL